jgi:4-amino-4-deoxychorismate lyase
MTMPGYMLVDGERRDHLPGDDRGLQYGDGLFETISVRDGKPCLWRRHLARLGYGCRRLGIPSVSSAVLASDARRLIHGEVAPRGVLKVILTRGSGPRGYRPPPHPTPRRVVWWTPTQPGRDDLRQVGAKLVVCETRLGENPMLAGIKHLNRLEQVLGRREWDSPDILDGIMCNDRGEPVCGTMSNLFFIFGSDVVTPSLTRCGVAGTVRSVVRDQATSLGISYTERPVERDELASCDGLFVTNAIIGAVPVARVGDRCLDAAAVPSDLIERVRRVAFEPETFA